MRGLTQKEFDWLQRVEGEIDKVWDELTGFEQKFMEDILEKFRRWGKSQILSAKQWEIIARISEKII